MSPRRRLPLANEFILLGFIHHTKVHGYELYKTFCQTRPISRIWRINQSNLYAILEKLENGAMLVSTPEPGISGPARKSYRLTTNGEAALKEWISTPVCHLRELRQEFMGKLYFSIIEGIPAARRLVEDQRQACETWLVGLESASEGNLTKENFEDVVKDFRRGQITAAIHWLEEIFKRLSLEEEIQMQ